MGIRSRSVTFHHAFRLPGMDETHPAGTFELQVDEEPIDVAWEAYHTRLTLMLPSPGRMEAWPVSEAELEAVLASDRASNNDTDHS